jgi:hypothetical protein
MFLQSLSSGCVFQSRFSSRIDLMRVIGQLAWGNSYQSSTEIFGGTSLNKLHSLGVSLSCSAVQSLFRRGS